ncbi:MAG: hypothetical protein IKV29_06835 [Alistipes sp.]|nr:hypothetical protein [Alistipes sp.]
MRRLITLLLAIFTIATLYAQEPTTVYCSIAGSQLTGRANGYIGPVEINFGQDSQQTNYLKDEDGRRINFKTMIQAVNYMSVRGWKLVSTYTLLSPSLTQNSNLDEDIIVMILSKEVTSTEQITEGL